LHILITAGPTREYIDPVRFVSNSSTGFFGYQIASEAVRRGHKVTLISGPVCLPPPKGARLISVVSALDMKSAVEKFFPFSDCLIMSAAVADYSPARVSPRKIKKNKKSLTLRLVKTPDILSCLAKKKKNKIVIGFALETEALKVNAQKKLKAKHLDYIVSTSIGNKRSPFGDRKVGILIIGKDGSGEKIFSSKNDLSRIILDKAESAKYPYVRRGGVPKSGRVT